MLKSVLFISLALLFLGCGSSGEESANSDGSKPGEPSLNEGCTEANGLEFVTSSADYYCSTKAFGSDFKAVHGKGNTIAVVNDSVLSISHDGGETFKYSGAPSGLRSGIIDVKVHSPTHIYVAAFSGLFISTDGGVTFTRKTSTDGLGSNTVKDLQIASSGDIYAATTGGLSISTDGGNTFATKTTAEGLPYNNLSRIFVNSEGDVYSVLAQKGQQAQAREKNRQSDKLLGCQGVAQVLYIFWCNEKSKEKHIITFFSKPFFRSVQLFC